MKYVLLAALGLLASTGLAGCAEEPTEEPGPPAEAKIDEIKTEQAPPPVIKLGTTWICLATTGTCPTGKQMMYCYPSGKEQDGIFSCKDPGTT